MLAAVLGTTGCETASRSDSAFCDYPFKGYVADLRASLEAHPETPNAVGEAGTDVVIGHEGGCQ